MELNVVSGRLEEQQVDTLVVTAMEDVPRLRAHAQGVDAALDGSLRAMRNDGLLTGRSGEVNVLPSLGRLPAKRVVVAGLGKAESLTIDRLRDAAGTLARRLRDLNAGRVAWSLDITGSTLGPEAVAAAVAEGALLGLYRFDRHHTKDSDRPRGKVEAITLVERSRAGGTAATRGAERGQILAEATNFARDLANEPANLMTPTILAGRAQQLAADHGLDCRVIERAEAERLGMGAYLSVANGSEQPPKFIVLQYHAPGASSTIGLIGKGITFDSGGISIKPAAGMERMKGDMSGAATVLGAMQAIARLKPAVSVTAVAPCTENLPSGSATKPGDVVYAMDGQSIEVLNTDAEGRLVLADGLCFAIREGCNPVIDVATLTGAMSVSLGNVRIGVFANDDDLYAGLERASTASGEKIWRMPLDDEYGDQIKSDVADMKNTGGQPAGSITAAKFLQRFTGEAKWAHLDIAGVMDSTSDKGALVKGSSGKPVRTLVHYVLGS